MFSFADELSLAQHYDHNMDFVVHIYLLELPVSQFPALFFYFVLHFMHSVLSQKPLNGFQLNLELEFTTKSYEGSLILICIRLI